MSKIELPVIALVGQKNVGKSTLFNRLTCSNTALVSSNSFGLTRDRQYGCMKYNQYKFIIIDTGGFNKLSNQKIQHYVNNQTILAIKEAHIIFFVVDGQLKESAVDYNIADYLRKSGKIVFVVVNKIDDISIYHKKYTMYDYYILGIKNVIAISAIHGYGINKLFNKVFMKLSKITSNSVINNTIYMDKSIVDYKNFKKSSLYDDIDSIKLAVVGRPNSGKSTFINSILKTNRVITSSIPGITRDSIYIPTVYHHQKYVLIDTAGIRKKNQIHDITERISVEKTLLALRNSDITLFMIDSSIGVVDQDLSLLKLVLNNSRLLIFIFNKWDISAAMNMNKKIVETMFRTRIHFIYSAKIHFISSLYGNGIKSLFRSIIKIFHLSKRLISTSQLTRIMYQAVIKYPPPLICGTRVAPKPKYVHIGGYNPIIIVIHGTRVSKLSREYRRYLRKCFYQVLHMHGVLIRIKFKDSVNPFINSV